MTTDPNGFILIEPLPVHYHERAKWMAHIVVEGFGDTEQEALDALILGYLSILDTDGRQHAVRFAQTLCGAIEAGRCHE